MFALGITLYELATATILPENGEAYQDLRNGRLEPMPALSEQFQVTAAKWIHTAVFLTGISRTRSQYESHCVLPPIGLDQEDDLGGSGGETDC